MAPLGIEPKSQAPETCILSIVLWGRGAKMQFFGVPLSPSIIKSLTIDFFKNLNWRTFAAGIRKNAREMLESYQVFF